MAKSWMRLQGIVKTTQRSQGCLQGCGRSIKKTGGGGLTAQLDVLAEGYADERVASTVVLVRDGDAVMVIDPGMVAHRGAILDPLSTLGLAPHQVTDVVFSHHHPDHTLNGALFPEARFHDHWARSTKTTSGLTDRPTGSSCPRASDFGRLPAIRPRTSPRWSRVAPDW